MNINLIVNGGVYSNQSAYTAYRFAQHALAAGHRVTQVFFYRDGVTQANTLAVPLADEFNAVEAWAELAREHSVPLVVCVSAAERRGVLDPDQQREFAKTAANLHSEFEVQGLGAMHDASLTADRTVTFK